MKTTIDAREVAHSIVENVLVGSFTQAKEEIRGAHKNGILGEVVEELYMEMDPECFAGVQEARTFVVREMASMMADRIL